MLHRYILKNKNDLERLVEFKKKRNGENYKNSNFTYLHYPQFDDFILIAETPDLGKGQLAGYALKEYKVGDIAAVYDGKVWEPQEESVITKICEEYKEPDDYMWQIDCGNGKSAAIDGCFQGSSAIFFNASDDPNVELRYIGGNAYYIATRDIVVGEEFTANYGNNYFDTVQRPYLSRKPAHLDIDILEDVMKTVAMEPNEAPCTSTNIVTKSITLKINELYFNDEGRPLLFYLDSSNQSHLETFNKTINKTFHKTSSYRLFAAPLMIDKNGKRRMGLFAGEDIPKNKRLCAIVGDDTVKKPSDNSNEFFQLSQHRYVSCLNNCSEASFVQGAYQNTNANVRMSGSYFMTTKNIQSGSMLLADYGSLPYTFDPGSFANICHDFNFSQNKNLVKYNIQNGNSSFTMLPFFSENVTTGTNVTAQKNKITHSTSNEVNPIPGSPTMQSEKKRKAFFDDKKDCKSIKLIVRLENDVLLQKEISVKITPV